MAPSTAVTVNPHRYSLRAATERGDVMSPAAKRFLGGLQHLSRQPRGMVLKQLQTQLKVAKGDTVPLANDTLAQIRHLKKTVAFIPGPDRSRPLEPASSSPSACRQDNRYGSRPQLSQLYPNSRFHLPYPCVLAGIQVVLVIYPTVRIHGT